MTTLQITFVSESAGYQNTLGWYNSRTGEAGIIFLNTNDDGRNASISSGDTALLEVDQADLDAGYIGFFLIPNGALRFGTGEDSVLNGPLSFDTKGNGDGKILDADGHNLTGAQGEVIFSDPALNKKDADYTQGDDDGSILGQIAFEDLVKKSDRDFNDLVIDVQVVESNRPPEVDDQSFAVAENSAAGTVVGQVVASDPDAGQTLSYAIVAGNEHGAFAINAETGAITVADASKLDFEDPALSSYVLSVRVTDNGSGALAATAVVSIGVTDVNEAPPPILGTPGNDSLFGTGGDDVILAGLGNDFLRGGAGNDLLDGGVVADFQSDVGFRDTDRADYSTASSGVKVNLATGIAQDGEGGTDTLIGIEAVNGSAFDDVLTGGSEAFVEFFHGGPGNDTIDGLGGPDRAEYMDATAGIAVNLAALAPNMGTVTGNASVGTDTLINIEIVYGSDFADSYVATGFSSASQPGGLLSTFNSFEGRAGDDVIVGNGSTRLEFTAATGGIVANLATGIATGDASVGTDTFSGVNSIRATQFADTLLGGNPLLNGFESFEGRAGDDYIEGGQGFDLAVYAFDGAITTGITVDLAAGTVTGDPLLTGTDTLRGVEGVQGSHLDDRYDATGFSASSLNAGSFGTNNEFQGMAGDDTIIGYGFTRIIYTAAREGVSVDLAAGTAVGGASVGTDTLVSGIWAVRGSNFNDVLIGSANGEFFEGRAGDDSIDGGDGFDTAAYDVGASAGGTFVANAASGFSATAAGLGTDALINIESIIGTNFSDLFDGSAASIGYSFDGRSGNDTLIGSQGGDFLNGGNGDDTLSGGAGDDFVDGGAGNDVVDGGDGFDQTHYEFGATSSGSFVANSLGVFTASAGGTGTDTLTSIEWITGTSFGDFFDASAAIGGYSFDGYIGDDTLIGSHGDDQLRGGDGNDVLSGGAGSDFLDGGFGSNDRADYSGAFGPVNVDLSFGTASDGMGGFDTLFGIEEVAGSAFDDSLLGDFASNALLGGEGNDLLRGGEGADYIDGGLGVDRIDYDSPWEGMDTVAGFEAVPGGDVIDIADLLQNWTGYAGGAGGPLSNFVRLEAFGFDAQLELNIGPGLWQPLAYLPGGGGLNLNTLVANGNLFTGAVSGITLIGTPGNDSLIGTPGNDTILADLGNDFLRGGGGNDLLNGGVVADSQSDVGFRDTDRADYSTAPGGVDVNLATGAALDGEGGMDTLIGIEAVTGSPFNDLLTGTSTFSENFLGGAGDDTIQGGGGFDRSDYQNATAGVTIIVGGFGGFATNSGTASGDASVGFDTLLDVEQFTGSEFDDSFSIGLFSTNSLPGGFFNNTNAFEGRGGDDVITGNGATRVEYTSAASAVTVDLAARTATGDASVGNDTFTGGVVEVRGSSFADTLLGGNPASNGLETFDGRGGNDVIDGKQGWDRADYAFNGPVSVGITVHLAAGTVTGDATLVGTDELHSVEAVRGTHLADLYDASGFSDLSANAGSSGMLNEFQGMAGDDTIIGNGSTRIAFGLAREGVTVDLQAGTVAGGASVGNDTILGGVFEVQGSQFDDTFFGSAGNDILRGSTGNDVLSGGAGSDLLDGGFGRDRADYSGSPGPVFVDLSFGTGNDGTGGVDTLLGNIEEVAGSSFDDSLNGNSFDNTLIGGMGNDFLRGGAGNDVLEGGIIADLQSDMGFRDTDRVDYSAAFGGVNVNLATGQASGADGNDTLIGIESVTGSMHADVLTGSDTTFSETFRGGAGSDTISGGGGFDRAEYLDAMSGVTINVGSFDVVPSSGATASDAFFSVGSDTLSDVELFTGSDFNDTYNVISFSSASQPGGISSSFNAFEGRGGDDFISGNGNTRVEYTSATDAVTVDLDSGATGDISVGNDTFWGGVNAVRGSSFNDTLLGSGFFSNESFEGRGGDDFIDGGQGLDRADYAFNGPAAIGIAVDLDLGIVTGDPVLAGADTLRSIEAIRGSHLDDVYDATGFSGFSVNAGSNGTLNEFEGAAGNDTIIGNGNTRVIYSFAREGVTVDLQAHTAMGGASVGTDTIVSGVNGMRGSNFDDVLMGTNHGITSAEIYEGRAGNDTFSGRGGFDQAVYISEGAQAGITVDMDAINAFTGTVTGDAAIGTDTLIDIVSVVGTFFDDHYDATGYNSAISTLGTFNEFEGGFGNDTIIGNGATRASFISAGAPVTVILGAEGSASGASSGNDVLTNVFSVRGSNFDDLLVGSALNDTFEGRGGFDTINGGEGFDLVRYDNGSNGPGTFISTGSGSFTASAGGHATDTLTNIESIRGTNFGDLFDGTVSLLGYSFDGRGGDDTLIGSQGFDFLLGGDGNDLLRGGLGSDIMDGGLGQDRFDFDSPAEGIDTIEGFEAVPGGDVLDIADLLDWTSYAGGAGGPLSDFVRLADIWEDAELQIDVDGASGPEGWQGLVLLRGHAGLDLAALLANGNLDVGAPGGGGVTVIGTPGNDVLEGGPGDDTLIGDLGNDLLIGHGGDDLLDGGIVADSQSDDGFRDTDRVDYSGASGSVNVNLATGQASGADGNDTLVGIESVNGSMHADTLTGSSTFNENFRGGAGNDQIFGSGGFDRAEYLDATAAVTINVGGAGNSSATVFGDASVGTDTLVDVEIFLGSDWADMYSAGSFSSASLPGGFSSNFNAFEGRAGNDSITGNGGTRAEYTSATGAVTVNLATGATGDASVGADTFFGGVNQVRGSSYNDSLTGTNSLGTETFDGRGGDDTIIGLGGWDRADYAFNGPIATGITVNLADGTVVGDPVLTGSDTLQSVEAIRGSHKDDVYNAAGFSDLSTNTGSSGMLNEFEGMAGDDIIIGNGSTRIVFGLSREGVSVDLQLGTAVGGASVGTDTIVGGVFDVRGSNFDDVLVGSLGNELLFGNSGNDLLRGGQGFDFLDGGAGSDRFDFDSLLDAGDSINFFAAGMGGDVLDIVDLMISSTSYPGGPFTDYVTIFSMGSDALLQVDPDGTGIQGWQTVATLIGRAGLTLDFLASNGNLEVGPGGGGGGVTLIGTPDNDNLFGSPGDDTLIGLQGNDFLVGFGGNDLLDGGIVADLQSDKGFRDTDRVDYSTAFMGLEVNLATGIALDGEGGTDTLIGIESVNGSMFNDLFTGSDTTFSENFHGAGGDDQIHGGGGFDRAEYHSAAGVWDPMLATFVGVTINVGGLGGFASAEATVSGDFFTVGFDTLSNVEQFTGSDWADTYSVGLFMSDPLPGGVLTSFNAFEGRGGNDSVFGNGNTRVDYTSATDAVTVDFSMGTASGDASVGFDMLSGVTQVRATSFNDTLLGSTFFVNETFDGRGGNDWIDGRGGFDRADYAFNGPAAFGIAVDLDQGVVTGDPVFTGTDDLRSIESIRGTHLADTYDASGFSGFSPNAGSSGTLNEFEGMAGDDFVIGNGNTRLTFSLAREAVTVDLLEGTVVGGASVGTDTISGVSAMRGSSFDDVFMGTNHGIAFAQIYEGRAGNDTFEGRGGYDQARYDTDPTQTGITVDMATDNGSNIGTVTGDLWIGTDTLVDIVAVVGTFHDDTYDGTGYFSSVSGLASFNEFEGLGGDDHITGNGATRISYISAGAGVTVQLGAAGSASGLASGFDTLLNIFNVRGSNFDDTLTGSIGDDTFEGRGGNDVIDGRGGFDLVRYDNGSNGAGSFIVDALGRFTTTAGGHHTDFLIEIESIRGTNFGDTFDGSASSLGFTFDARGGNDTLIGSQGNDTLLGGDGNDLLRGGLGGDSMDGGAGADTFDFDHLDEAADTVSGFEAVPGGDVLDIADLLLNSTSYAGGAGGALADFVRLQAASPDAQLQIDSDGSAGGGDWQTLATLLGGSGLSLDTLVNGGNLDFLI